MKFNAWILTFLAGTVFAASARGANTCDALYEAGIKAGRRRTTSMRRRRPGEPARPSSPPKRSSPAASNT